MAHAFQIMDTTNTINTYTDYDAIPLATLKHVISFIPDLGTLVDSNEIVFESSPEEATFDINTALILDNESVIKKYLYGATSSTGTDLLIKNSSGSTLKTIRQSSSGDAFVIKNSSGTAITSFTFSTTEISSGTTYTQSVDLGFRDKLAREDFDSDLENHLLLETADDNVVDNHYHETTERAHYDGDGHTEDEHRDIALWNYRLQLLVTQEKTNASSN